MLLLPPLFRKSSGKTVNVVKSKMALAITSRFSRRKHQIVIPGLVSVQGQCHSPHKLPQFRTSIGDEGVKTIRHLPYCQRGGECWHLIVLGQLQGKLLWGDPYHPQRRVCQMICMKVFSPCAFVSGYISYVPQVIQLID